MAGSSPISIVRPGIPLSGNLCAFPSCPSSLSIKSPLQRSYPASPTSSRALPSPFHGLADAQLQSPPPRRHATSPPEGTLLPTVGNDGRPSSPHGFSLADMPPPLWSLGDHPSGRPHHAPLRVPSLPPQEDLLRMILTSPLGSADFKSELLSSAATTQSEGKLERPDDWRDTDLYGCTTHSLGIRSPLGDRPEVGLPAHRHTHRAPCSPTPQQHHHRPGSPDMSLRQQPMIDGLISGHHFSRVVRAGTGLLNVHGQHNNLSGRQGSGSSDGASSSDGAFPPEGLGSPPSGRLLHSALPLFVRSSSGESALCHIAPERNGYSSSGSGAGGTGTAGGTGAVGAVSGNSCTRLRRSSLCTEARTVSDCGGVYAADGSRVVLKSRRCSLLYDASSFQQQQHDAHPPLGLPVGGGAVRHRRTSHPTMDPSTSLGGPTSVSVCGATLGSETHVGARSASRGSDSGLHIRHVMHLPEYGPTSPQHYSQSCPQHYGDCGTPLPDSPNGLSRSGGSGNLRLGRFSNLQSESIRAYGSGIMLGAAGHPSTPEAPHHPHHHGLGPDRRASRGSMGSAKNMGSGCVSGSGEWEAAVRGSWDWGPDAGAAEQELRDGPGS